MTISLRAQGVRGVVLDIEGTTTPIAFVHEVLFPYARTNLRAFLSRHSANTALREVLRRLHAEQAFDAVSGDPATYVEWLMTQDRKSTGLKQLQGMIWEGGYRDGTLRSEVYADVPRALERWRDAGLTVAIFSSGSVLAQQLLFANTKLGDLSRYFGHHFDTFTGPKQSPESYRRIAEAMHQVPAELLFVSDVVGELEAAKEGGMHAVLCVRPGNAPQAGEAFDTIRSFDELGD